MHLAPFVVSRGGGPWFGAWPPSPKGRPMTTGNDSVDRWIKRWGVSALLFVIALLGAGGVALTFPRGLWQNVYFEHLSMAVAVAAFIGLFIELTLQRQLARNVFEAALGYLLPERLRTELRWIYNQQVIATQHYEVHITHHKAEGRVVFEGTYRRRFENISDRTVSWEIGGGIEEQFSKFGDSKVIAWTVKRIDKYVSEEKQNNKAEKIIPDPHLYGFGNQHPKQKIAPHEILEVVMSYVLCLPDHGMEYLTYRCPIDSPSVTIYSPDTLRVELTFSHRDNEEFPIEAPVTSHTLERVLLPHQDIKVSWHDKEDVSKRAAKHGLKV